MTGSFHDTNTISSSVAVYTLPPSGESTPTFVDNDKLDAQRYLFLLRQNANWFCHLRWIVIGFLTTVGILAFLPALTAGLGVDLSPTWLLSSAAILLVANSAHVILLRRSATSVAVSRVRILLWSQIVVDLIILTVVIHFLGTGVRYAPVTYLFHIILACIFFHRSESLGVILVSAVLLIGLICLESAGLIAYSTVVKERSATLRATEWGVQCWQLASLLTIWVIIWHLVSRLSAQLRDRERELIITNRRLEESSVERARHMLQTTHELKAPFAAIHASTQLLLGNYAGPLTDQARKVVEKISARSNLLSTQIQEMLQLANLRSQSQTTPTARLIDMQKVVEGAVERVEAQARLRHLFIDTDLESVQVYGADDHLTMLIDNLLHNAVNYSFDHGKIAIECRRISETTANVVVRDYGIGIPAEKLPHIFQDYYRTTEATRHNRASTGLGLAIVKLVAKALQIAVTIESSPGWGTRVTLNMPTVSEQSATSPISQGE